MDTKVSNLYLDDDWCDFFFQKQRFSVTHLEMMMNESETSSCRLLGGAQGCNESETLTAIL